MPHFHHYRAFGWNIKSEIELPELTEVPVTENHDVLISFGEVPTALENARKPGKNTFAKKEQFLFMPHETMRFWAIESKEIKVWKDESLDDSELRSYLLASVFGAIAHQRGMLPLHGSAVSHNGQTFIFCGVTGSGKSTTAAGLHKLGFDVFSEDLSAIESQQNDIPYLHFGAQRIKLMVDALKSLGYNENEFPPLPNTVDKRSLPLENKSSDNKLPVKRIYILSRGDVSNVEIRKLSQIECLRALLHHTFRQRLVAALDIQKEHFNLCMQLSQQIEAYKVIRPSNMDSISITTERIADHIKIC